MSQGILLLFRRLCIVLSLRWLGSSLASILLWLVLFLLFRLFRSMLVVWFQALSMLLWSSHWFLFPGLRHCRSQHNRLFRLVLVLGQRFLLRTQGCHKGHSHYFRMSHKHFHQKASKILLWEFLCQPCWQRTQHHRCLLFR